MKAAGIDCTSLFTQVTIAFNESVRTVLNLIGYMYIHKGSCTYVHTMHAIAHTGNHKN